MDNYPLSNNMNNQISNDINTPYNSKICNDITASNNLIFQIQSYLMMSLVTVNAVIEKSF